MKILVISTPIFRVPVSGYAGLEHLCWQQAAGLAAKGHSVSLVAPDGSTCPGVTIISIGPERGTDERRAYSRYWQMLPFFDVIIDSTWQKWTYSLKREGRLKVPVLGVCHAPVDTMYKELPKVEKPCFVCISEDQRKHFEGLFGQEARTACNGVDLDFYKPLGIKRSGRFLFLARFSSVKSPDLAIEACKQAGAGLDLVGDTSITNEPDYLRKCQAMCDGKQIRFVGPATRAETVWWYSQAHALIHSTKNFREPFGLAPVEAMACCCPVIGWRKGALPETVDHGRSGWLVNSLEELTGTVKLVSESPATVEMLRDPCRWQAGKFSLGRMNDRYEELCKEAIETGGW